MGEGSGRALVGRGLSVPSVECTFRACHPSPACTERTAHDVRRRRACGTRLLGNLQRTASNCASLYRRRCRWLFFVVDLSVFAPDRMRTFGRNVRACSASYARTPSHPALPIPAPPRPMPRHPPHCSDFGVAVAPADAIDLSAAARLHDAVMLVSPPLLPLRSISASAHSDFA